MNTLLAWIFIVSQTMTLSAAPNAEEYKGREFVGISRFAAWQKETTNSQSVWNSPLYACHIAADEIVLSWNAETPAGTGLTVEARAQKAEGIATKWYVMGKWSKDGTTFPRESVKGQTDSDGTVATDTLVLTSPPETLQVRVTLHAAPDGTKPTLKFLGISLADTKAKTHTQTANRAAWGKEIVVPSKTQTGWADANGWCSPTSTSMTLAFWSEKTKRPEMDVPVPEAAKACFDKIYDGTGNWAFNAAFAGSFPSIRAYVARFSDVRELENWTVAGLPVVVSLSYDLLKGTKRANDPGHLMVCAGFAANGDIVLNDPAHHPERGETARHVFPRANFLKAWAKSKNTVYLLYPEGTTLPPDPLHHWDSVLGK